MSSTSELLFSQLCASQDPSSLLRNYLPSVAEDHRLDWFYSLLNAGERGATATLEARWAVWETVAEGQALWREAGFESREQYQMNYGFAKLLDEMLRSQDVRNPRAVTAWRNIWHYWHVLPRALLPSNLQRPKIWSDKICERISACARAGMTHPLFVSLITECYHQRLKDAQKLYRSVLRSNHLISRDVENVWTYVQANLTTFRKLAVKLHHDVGHLTIEGEHDVNEGEVEEEIEERVQVEASVTPGPASASASKRNRVRKSYDKQEANDEFQDLSDSGYFSDLPSPQREPPKQDQQEQHRTPLPPPPPSASSVLPPATFRGALSSLQPHQLLSSKQEQHRNPLPQPPPSASSILPPATFRGALSSLQPHQLLSSTAIELIQKSFPVKEVRDFDPSWFSHFTSTTPPTAFNPSAARLRRSGSEKTWMTIWNFESHWTLLVIDLEHRVVRSWNSMRSTQAPLKKAMEKGLGSLLLANLIEYRDFQYDAVECPQQSNATDCGVYACVFMLYAKLGLEKELGMSEGGGEGEGKLIVDVETWRSLFLLLLEFLDPVNDGGNIEVQGRIPSLRRAPRRDVITTSTFWPHQHRHSLDSSLISDFSRSSPSTNDIATTTSTSVVPMDIHFQTALSFPPLLHTTINACDAEFRCAASALANARAVNKIVHNVYRKIRGELLGHGRTTADVGRERMDAADAPPSGGSMGRVDRENAAAAWGHLDTFTGQWVREWEGYHEAVGAVGWELREMGRKLLERGRVLG